MTIKEAYNNWASQYDTNKNRTRDLEGLALRTVLKHLSFTNCLEMGCGTGKNTGWLAQHAAHVTAVDFSENMLQRAKASITAYNVTFIQADITENRSFSAQPFDLITFSLVLEHMAQLSPILKQATESLLPGGLLYIGELHPFKQYTGTKARFETATGRQEVPCFTHHISEFVQAGKQAGLEVQDVQEYFDADDKTGIPRILALLFRKP